MEIPVGEEANGGREPRTRAAPPAGGPLAGYYDRLSVWTTLAHAVGYGGGRGALTVHRALADPLAGGHPTASRVHDIVLAALPSPPSGHVLDAGCGLGGTMLAFAARSAARFTGLTVSERQAAIARRAIARAGLAHRIDVRVQSYDSPPEGPFDLAVAIESLAHSPHPGASITAIAERIVPGGRLVIVDDMPELAARGTRDLAVFQAGWRAPALLGSGEIESAVAAGGLTIVAERDLSADLRPRALVAIAGLERLNRTLYRMLPSPGLRATLDSYYGGLALERLYRRALMRYRLIVAEKPS